MHTEQQGHLISLGIMYICTICGREFEDEDAYGDHIFMVESGYHCSKCHSSNVRSEYETNSVPYGDTTVTESHAGDIQCMDCGNKF